MRVTPVYLMPSTLFSFLCQRATFVFSVLHNSQLSLGLHIFRMLLVSWSFFSSFRFVHRNTPSHPSLFVLEFYLS